MVEVVAPYGSWKSPITSDLIVANFIGIGDLSVEGETLYWSEVRPSEGGRNAILRLTPDGHVTDLLPQPWNARTRVHEYGGGGYLVHEGILYFSNFADQRVYRMVPGQEPQPISPPVDLRYADGTVDAARGRIIYVREDHRPADREAINTIASLRMDGGDLESGGQVLVSGNDFYSDPRLSPDGRQLLWLTWNHPNLPWDGGELWLAEIGADGSLQNPRQIAGGMAESIFQPEWSQDGLPYFVSDRSGWWNLYRWQSGKVEALHPLEAEFGEPQWVFRSTTYAFESPGRLVCSYFQRGQSYLAALDTHSLSFEPVPLPYTELSSIVTAPGKVYFTGGSPTQTFALVQLDLISGKTQVIKRSTNLEVDPGYISVAEEIEFPTENGRTAYAFYYPPRNRDFRAPEGDLPPLIVMSHGGPTGATTSVLRMGIQYWTSRGFAMVDVNYGGSTGYGRAYRERLKGQWGVVDVDDCVNAARYLVQTGQVDGERLAITGGSAGGYTTLSALAFRDVFKVGACYFGLSELEIFVRDTHKFESRYLDGLVGPYPAAKDIYFARSPINFTNQLNCALILFQGSEDKIVPPSQSRLMYEAVKTKGLPVAYIEYEGEQHGFRRAANIKNSLDSELYFYSRIFGFSLAEKVEPVKIENL